MKNLLSFLLILFCFSGTYGQPTTAAKAKLTGKPCEGCEAIFEYGSKKLTSTDTLPGFKTTGPRLLVTGTVYLPDGKTPAKDVILYIYHTNQQGLYASQGQATGWAKRHGAIRGWVKTGPDGKYSFYTLRPGVYPDRSEPAHIHLMVLEPTGNYYYLESFYFANDNLLTAKERNPTNPRGGHTGLLTLRQAGNI